MNVDRRCLECGAISSIAGECPLCGSDALVPHGAMVSSLPSDIRPELAIQALMLAVEAMRLNPVESMCGHADDVIEITVCQGSPRCALEGEEAVSAQRSGCPWCERIFIDSDGGERTERPGNA